MCHSPATAVDGREATRLRMDAKMSGQTMSATTTASTITTQEVMSWRFWPSTWSQQKAMVSAAEADGNSESSATREFLAEGVPGVRAGRAPAGRRRRAYELMRSAIPAAAMPVIGGAARRTARRPD